MANIANPESLRYNSLIDDGFTPSDVDIRSLALPGSLRSPRLHRPRPSTPLVSLVLR